MELVGNRPIITKLRVLDVAKLCMAKIIPPAELHDQVDSLTSTCAHMIWDVDLGIVGTVCVLQTMNHAGS